MITKDSVKVQKCFKLEFILDEHEFTNFRLLLAHGVSSVCKDESFEGVIKDDDKEFMRNLRDYVISVSDYED